MSLEIERKFLCTLTREEAATTYRKDDYTKEEAIKDYQTTGIY
jgi:hypothetical protein